MCVGIVFVLCVLEGDTFSMSLLVFFSSLRPIHLTPGLSHAFVRWILFVSGFLPSYLTTALTLNCFFFQFAQTNWEVYVVLLAVAS